MFSYSALNNRGKVTLPSVEGYGDLNILKDPPKSIHTRRIDKVGDTSEITSMRDDSGDRSCEAISVYARGVNPSVSVSYSSEGNNGGNRSSGIDGGGCQTSQPYYSHTVARDGAFRPPAWRSEDLYPRSRLPRLFTEANTNKQDIDYARGRMQCGEAKDYRQVKTETLRGEIRPTVRYKVNTQIKEPFEIKYAIQPLIRTSANSGTRTLDVTSQFVQTPKHAIQGDNMHVFAQTKASENRHVNTSVFHTDPFIQDSNVFSAESNPSRSMHVNNSVFHTDKFIQDSNVFSAESNPSRSMHVNNSVFNTDKFIQDANVHDASTNPSRNVYVNNSKVSTGKFIQDTNTHQVNTNPSPGLNVTAIDQVVDLSDMHTKDALNVSYTTQASGSGGGTIDQVERHLERRLPQHSATTNRVDNRQQIIRADKEMTLNRRTPIMEVIPNVASQNVSESNSSREYYLPEKIQPGGFEARGQTPTMDRPDFAQRTGQSDRARMARSVMEQQHARYLP